MSGVRSPLSELTFQQEIKITDSDTDRDKGKVFVSIVYTAVTVSIVYTTVAVSIVYTAVTV